ncbi:7-carboxy-7-deazaguanine synthase QueE [Runella slithyformis]|uniref:7-carboxy-7-deazaguanine synthase n=1 Tax=Runella slithyformis (strain ATCC 29530 / DSM 19594 / LMG 11500 / NCIMB 11436 / LSU 4) TaxID=761193 RepID=A0A7U3ZG93_RUNSL|nr:7-carboxy-7-deazaguanine synthase QueE [Runella slithyformis]AEI46658.1 Radical SAM domain protein [Runella slithyformis DSM 19594]
MNEVLPLMEAFYTLQGEGYHSGKAAYFIRLGGCDVGCVWCDVKESWEADAHPKVSVENIVSEALRYPARMAVVTGGEPLMHNLDKLTEVLQASGFHTNIETSGAHPMSGRWDWVCFSPKKFKAPHSSVYAQANELKVIVYNKTDFEFAEHHAALVNENCVLLLQPEWSRVQEMTPLIVDYVKQHPQWRVSLQTHKYMDIP